MTPTKESIIEMLHRINGANGIFRTEEEILELAEGLFKKAQETYRDLLDR